MVKVIIYIPDYCRLHTLEQSDTCLLSNGNLEQTAKVNPSTALLLECLAYGCLHL